MRISIVSYLYIFIVLISIEYQEAFAQSEYSGIAIHSNQGDCKDSVEAMTSEEYFGIILDHISFLTNMAEKYYYNGNIGESIRLQEEALSVVGQHFGESEYINYSNLNRLADYYSYNNDPSTAIQLGKNAIKLIVNDKGKNSAEYAFALTSMANYYCDLGNFDRAIELGKEALKLKKELGLENDLSYAISLNNLGKYYSLIEDFKTSASLIKQSLIIRESLSGKEDPFYASSLNNLGVIYSRIGKYTDAINSIQESIKLKKLFFKDSSYDYINALVNLAAVYSTSGNINESIIIYNNILNSYDTKYLMNCPAYFSIMWNLSSIYDTSNDLSNITQISKKISEYILFHLKNRFRYLPLNERNIYWNACAIWPNIRLPKFNWKYSDNELSVISYNASLYSKGIILNSELDFDKFIVENDSKELSRKFNLIKRINNRLDNLYKMAHNEPIMEIDSLEQYANELERQLMQESAEYGDYTRSLSVTWRDVRNNLKKVDAAIEFVSFPLNKDSTMYMAYVLRHDMDAPALVKLFEEKEISSLSDDDLYKKTKGSELIWAKLQPELNGVDNIYFAPDGMLHQIGIESFPDFDDFGKLISDRFNLYRLSSTRQLAVKNQGVASDNAVVYGGIQYDISPDVMVAESRKYDIPSSRGIQSFYNVADSLSIRAGIDFLPFTLTEATSVSDLLQNAQKHYQLIAGNEATEESFKNLSGNKNRVLHIATHGFYWEKDEAEYRADLNERLLFMSQFGDNARRNIEDKALTRSGLFMAGVNNVLTGKDIPDGVDDGILTAQEIANLDFRGLDLVVLSACQTGMGDISGDGVFGLQRGFKKAGANSILMSLWDVNDEATQILMTNFYKNYLNGMSKRESLLAAQKAVRETPGFEDQDYWAAFILLDGLN